MPRGRPKVVHPPSLREDDEEQKAPGLPEQTLQAILDGFNAYIPGIIQTLGMASQPKQREDGSWEPGDTDAAKKALDFLGKAMAGTKAEGRAANVLAKLAELRNSVPDDE